MAIGGIASLDYRLSPWDRLPTSPSSPDHAFRQARHPDHLDDVASAMGYLQRRFYFGDRYILVGHSCGATLAFQYLAWNATKARPAGHMAPQAIVGVAGLYDLPLLRDMDPEPPACQDFISAAFGPDETVWKEQSPANPHYDGLWATGRLAVLAICREDEYVSHEQRTQMARARALESWADGRKRSVRMIEVDGRHDDNWKEGVGLANCTEVTLSHLLTDP